jgi:tyrosine-protein kinase Etk/Wzc
VDLLDAKYRMHVEKLEQARVNDALRQDRITNVNVAQPATFVTKPVSPRKSLILAMGLVVAVFGAVGIAFCVERCDQTLRTTDQAQAQLGVPVLLSVPYQASGSDSVGSQSKNTTTTNGQGHGSKKVGHLGDYRSLVREIIPRGEQQINGASRAKTVGVVGCDTSALRSQVAGDLAIQAAQTSTAGPVLLIDADVAQRNIANRFNINGSSGWCDILAGEADPQSCVQRQDFANLAIMGPGQTNGHTAAKTDAAPLHALKSEFGLVVVDLPDDVDSAAVPADFTWLDEAILVVEAERTRVQSAQHAKEALCRAGVHVKGVVLTNRREHIPHWLYQRL